jgi:hypothetical protein
MPPPWFWTISLRSIHAIASSRTIAGAWALLRQRSRHANSVAPSTVSVGAPVASNSGVPSSAASTATTRVPSIVTASV